MVVYLAGGLVNAARVSFHRPLMMIACTEKREGSSTFLPVEVLLDHARSCAVFFAPLALL